MALDQEVCGACGAPVALEAAQRTARHAAAGKAAHRRVVIRRWRGRGLLAVAVVAVLVAGGALLVRRGADTPPARYTLTGRLDLIRATGNRAPTYVVPTSGQGACRGVGDYAEVRIGMPITVEGDTGLLIGQGWLDAGHVTTDGEGSSPACTFTFTVPGLAEGAAYQVSAGDLASVDLSLEELKAADWEVTLTVGP